jgi:pimeloyl-ACP methyl ester carboxylesterase
VSVPALDGGDFEHLTITSQLRIIDEALGAGPAALMGSSLGGYLAALCAARRPEIPGVVLMAPAFEFGRRFRSRAGEAAVVEWRRRGSADFFHYGAGRQMQLGFGLIEDADRYEDFPEVTQPCLIFHGLRDDVVPVDLSRQFAAQHSNTQLIELDSGHELTDALDIMGPRVEGFLASLAPS